MEEITNIGTSSDSAPVRNMYQDADFMFFNNLDTFSKAVERGTGIVLDFAQIIELNTDFMQASNQYLVVNIKEYDSDEPNNLLLLTENKAYGYSKTNPQLEIIGAFEDILLKPFGRSTILCFLILDKVLSNHKMRLEKILKAIKKLDDDFVHVQYRSLATEIELLGDRLDEFHELLLKLQERKYKQVETTYISFDYHVLLAESLSLQGRCRRRSNTLKQMRQDHEMKATEDLNQRIVKLNDVVKKLTAVTVILMLPTLIASHFGMNFTTMPELSIPWAYPAVIVAQLVLMGIGYVLFKKIGWL